MRTTEERIASMHKRASEIETESRRRKVLIAQAASVVICLALVITAAIMMPGIESGHVADTGISEMNASVFAGSPVLAYIVIGIIAFFLGTAVTVFCFRLKRWEQRKNTEVPYGREH